MEHFTPHSSSVFEDHYSKFSLPSGASLALIICSVPQASERPHVVSFTYVPQDVSKIFQKEVWVKRIERIRTGPKAFRRHIWIQARDGARGFCCAGGQILGMQAYLLGYRSADYVIDFQPPFALQAFGIAPFMSVDIDWESRAFELSVQNFRQKIMVHATAPAGAFFGLSAPFSDGHRENYLGENFQAMLDVEVYRSGLFGAWRLLCKDQFEGSLGIWRRALS